MRLMRLLASTAALFVITGSNARADVDVLVTYLRQQVKQPPVLSNLDPIPENLGPAGAEVGLKDNQTTGQFLGHNYSMELQDVPIGGDLLGAAQEALNLSPFIVLDAPAADILRVADLPEAEGALIFNVAAPDVELRNDACRANLLHSIPSDVMRSDALIQFLGRKKWSDLALVSGTHESDIRFSDALKYSAWKFGLTIQDEKTWVFDADMRRNAAQEVPLFTQDFKDHDVLLVADEIGDFGRYIAYNTWLPRPIAGSEGMVPQAWSHVVEQWGAAQLQSRFHDHTGRDMRSKDYAAWAALRTIGEAVTRTGSNQIEDLRSFILSDAFELGGFKGRPMNYRDWNGQLRQPIPIVTDRALVAQAPIDGYLHQMTELDTLGLDRPESKCTAFKE